MGEGYWSPTAVEGGEWHGVPGQGCWFRKNGGQAYWMTDGPHQYWNGMGAEGGFLGFPTSNFDADTGIQTFENGCLWWNGQSWVSGKEPRDAKPFRSIEPPPPLPAG